ncbi:MAG: RdgB/HAM1 family non-canonical purine NTP pyrophosphatase [Flavobacteriaceae bacterium]|nr:RdgB/HAM1 family non-canonical purine NTP pyrophosphatase [Flavobacteriaceae bacterium]PHX77608.1 MAG: non-canonical purine NTP pyrophosphatase, RdgB/HAM1 family [Flavobacteriales bacterium]
MGVELQTLVFATNNQHKIDEAQAIVQGKLHLISLKEAGVDIDVDETETTFRGNALLKAEAVWALTGLPCVADDSGLCVESLEGEPGVYSSRYAGEAGNHNKNNKKLLRVMVGKADRRAFFITVLCLVGFDDKPTYIEGRVNGVILTEIQGRDGFGYDPLFCPDGETRSFAEMSAAEKNAMSHRGRAFQSLMEYLG